MLRNAHFIKLISLFHLPTNEVSIITDKETEVQITFTNAAV